MSLVTTDENDAPTVVFRRGVDVVIVRRTGEQGTGGHVVIVTSKRIDTTEVAVAIRQREAEKRGWTVRDDDSLGGEHSVSVPNWDYNPTAGHLFNVEEQKVADVLPTALSDADLLELVLKHGRFK